MVQCVQHQRWCNTELPSTIPHCLHSLHCSHCIRVLHCLQAHTATLLNTVQRGAKCMYNCYATALRWNKSPIRCTACGDAEKFLLGWFPPWFHRPHPGCPPPSQLPQTTRPSEAAHKPTSINITIQFWLSCDAIAICMRSSLCSI